MTASPTVPETVTQAKLPPHTHTRTDDAQGIAFGAVMAAFSAFLLGSAGLITGQLAGLALLLSQATGYSFGPVYLVLSLPFYGFGYRRLGAGFLRRTIAAVLLMVASVVVAAVYLLRQLGRCLRAACTGRVPSAGDAGRSATMACAVARRGCSMPTVAGASCCGFSACTT